MIISFSFVAVVNPNNKYRKVILVLVRDATIRYSASVQYRSKFQDRIVASPIQYLRPNVQHAINRVLPPQQRQLEEKRRVWIDIGICVGRERVVSINFLWGRNCLITECKSSLYSVTLHQGFSKCGAGTP